MATRVRRVSDFAKHGMQYLLRRDQVSPLERERDREKVWLKAHIDENGVKDSKGNRNAYFDAPVPGPGSTIYYGLQQRRTPGAEFMDENEIRKFMKDHPDIDISRVIYHVTTEVVDAEELYVLHQEGKITAKELRSLIRHKPDSFQLWPITEPPITPEDDEEE